MKKKQLTTDEIMEILRKELSFLEKTYGVMHIAVFGSVAKGEQKERSDVDILVELREPLGFAFIRMARHLEKILGRKVDISTTDCLDSGIDNPRYRHIARDIQRTMRRVA
ncbi:nucleotidyltransferase family protein [Geotalea uraniireducens]|uniref:DNA polymerase, beta domain protein region n=1 Tax=Geotalea uraniireducens (strain Rf4) TaxID=351605 RepID=A5G940_GEOUR|nr:nucleotidyltransferase family protein [Geotalea uraniireducens]ABQ28308.1 DNA polymerase, beta domain protein region [Geotalea uraniireducens Rf4]